MRKDYVCTPCEYRTFLLLTASSNVGDRINSTQKSGNQSDRRDVISGERVAVILSYRINDKQKIRNRAPGIFLWVIIKPVDTNLGRFAVETEYRLDAWKVPKSVLKERFTILFYIHKLRIHLDISYEFIYFCNYLIENNTIKIQALMRHIYIYICKCI